jgi:ubiquinone/menaquinone biosynthesis C-methylase UbiE
LWRAGWFVLVGLYSGDQVLSTLNQLDIIEAEPDHWQRSSKVVQALDLKPVEAVVDLGCGSGPLSLKLAEPVGPNGRVIAEDIRRLSLAFLWMRTLRKGKHNVRVLLGDVDNPQFDPNSVIAVLISNSYHGFAAHGRAA